MESLKSKILHLRSQGLTNAEISKQLKCSTSTVSYHTNPQTKKNTIDKKKIRRLMKEKDVHPYMHKEIDIEITKVCWKYSEIICIAKMVELGYEVFTPINDGSEIDFIAYKGGKSLRVQVKSVSPKNKNSVEISLIRRTINYKNSHSHPYQNIDIFLIYDGNNIYKLPFDEVNNSIVLRYKTPKNNITKGIYMASDYII